MPYCAYCGTPVDAVSYKPCPSCGNPTNGAVRPAVTGGGSNTAVVVLIVFVVALVGIAIVGILAAIAVPNLVTAMQRSKQHRTIADVRVIASSVETYAADNNKHYPEALDMNGLAQKLEPKYVSHLPTKDGWGNLFRYDCWNTSGGTTCDSYVIASAAKDGNFEVDDPKQYKPSDGTTSFDCDIVFENGAFIEYPRGFQVQ